MENDNILDTQKTLTENVVEQPKIPLYESVSAWIAFALGFIFTHFAAPYFGGVWGGIFWAAFGVLIAVYSKKNSIALTKFHVVMLSAAELFCLVPLFSANRFINFLAACYSFALYFYLLSVISGADAFGRHFVGDFFRSLLTRPFGELFRQPVFAFSLFKGKGRAKNILYAVVGIIIAIPLTVIVMSLLMSSDDTFNNIMKGLSEFLPNFSFSLIGEILLAVPIAMYIFGALFSVKKPAAEHFGTPEYRFLPPVVSYFAVSPICVFYFFYIIVQIGNISQVLGGNGEISYSDFARKGFFELCAIAVIDLAVIVLIQTFSKRGADDRKPTAMRVYGVVLSALTLVMIATALIKMFMYINEYGMTLMRMYTSWFMILLAAIFILLIVFQFRDYKIWKALFAAFTVLFAILCFGNFEGNIAAYNINAYRSGALETLDVDQFSDELGTAAVAPAYELYKSCDDEHIKEELRAFIENESDYDKTQPRFAYFSIPRAISQKAFNEMGLNAAEDGFKVVIHVESSDVLSVTAEYSLGGEPMGGQEIAYADGSAIIEGDELVFKFTEKSFKDPDKLSQEPFGIFFIIKDIRGEVSNIPIKDRKAEFGEEYHLILKAGSDGCYIE